MYPEIRLKKGKEGSVIYGHPWIFSGAVEDVGEDVVHGGLVTVVGHDGAPLGVGTYSERSSITVRVYDRAGVTIDSSWFARAIMRAEERRRLLGFGATTDTTGYRIVFSEADGIPGVIIDRYGDVVVMQLSTAGAEALRGELLGAIDSALSPSAIIERSEGAVRQEDGLSPRTETVSGSINAPVPFMENGLAFTADVLGGQKTGFFLDQRDTRAFIRKIAKGRRTLNLFSYTGASGVAALAGGAASVMNIDGSEEALAMAASHATRHGQSDRTTNEHADVFQYLGMKTDAKYDTVIVDPPALIKNARDAEEGGKAYHFLNRAALRLVADSGVYVTSSCSRFLSEDDFAFILRRAATQAGVRIEPLSMIRQSPDHPISPTFPESLYLKTIAVLVRR